MYRIFDIALQCSLPLPGLADSDRSDAFIRVDVNDGGYLDETGFQWLQHWKTPCGEVSIMCAKRGGDYLLRFPQLCDFHIFNSGQNVVAYPVAGVSESTVAHLIVDQVIPRVLAHDGRTICHASAVVASNETAIVFLGESGGGKSTLASSFFRSGFALLSDDCLQLSVRDGRVYGLSAYPSIRLWPKTARQIFPENLDFTDVGHFTEKRQLLLKRSDQTVTHEVPVAAIFALNKTGQGGSDQEVAIRPINGMDSAMKMIEAAFVLDLKTRVSVHGSFANATKIAQSGVPFFSLSFPRKFEKLDLVQQQILEKIQA